jgi:hypothetical protein
VNASIRLCGLDRWRVSAPSTVSRLPRVVPVGCQGGVKSDWLSADLYTSVVVAHEIRTAAAHPASRG